MYFFPNDVNSSGKRNNIASYEWKFISLPEKQWSSLFDLWRQHGRGARVLGVRPSHRLEWLLHVCPSSHNSPRVVFGAGRTCLTPLFSWLEAWRWPCVRDLQFSAKITVAHFLSFAEWRRRLRKVCGLRFLHVHAGEPGPADGARSVRFSSVRSFLIQSPSIFLNDFVEIWGELRGEVGR